MNLNTSLQTSNYMYASVPLLSVGLPAHPPVPVSYMKTTFTTPSLRPYVVLFNSLQSIEGEMCPWPCSPQNMKLK